jgi:hypothetical protein
LVWFSITSCKSCIKGSSSEEKVFKFLLNNFYILKLKHQPRRIDKI